MIAKQREITLLSEWAKDSTVCISICISIGDNDLSMFYFAMFYFLNGNLNEQEIS